MGFPVDIETNAAHRVREIGERLNGQVTELSEMIWHELRQRITALPDDQVIQELLHASVVANLENVSYLFRGQVPLENLPVPPPAYEYARRIAQRDSPLGALLRAYRLGQRRILDWAYGEISTVEPDPVVAFAAGQMLSGLTFDYVDRISEGVVDAYQAEREQWLANRNTVRLDVLTSLLRGERVDLSVAENALSHRLRQHHLGMLIWRTGTASGTTTGDLRDLERLAAAIGRTCEAAGSPLFIPRDREQRLGVAVPRAHHGRAGHRGDHRCGRCRRPRRPGRPRHAGRCRGRVPHHARRGRQGPAGRDDGAGPRAGRHVVRRRRGCAPLPCSPPTSTPPGGWSPRPSEISLPTARTPRASARRC